MTDDLLAGIGELPPPETRFRGKETYSPDLDCARLTGQLAKVYAALSDGQWWCLSRLTKAAGGSEAGVKLLLNKEVAPVFEFMPESPRDAGWPSRQAGQNGGAKVVSEKGDVEARLTHAHAELGVQDCLPLEYKLQYGVARRNGHVDEFLNNTVLQSFRSVESPALTEKVLDG